MEVYTIVIIEIDYDKPRRSEIATYAVFSSESEAREALKNIRCSLCFRDDLIYQLSKNILNERKDKVFDSEESDQDILDGYTC